MTSVILRVLVHSELSNLPLTCTQIIGVTDFGVSYYYPMSFFLQHFDNSRSLDSATKSGCLFKHAFHFFLLTPWGLYSRTGRGWSCGVKVACILRHRGVQLILACSWARPAILVAGKGRGGMFLFLQFLHFHSCSSFFPIPLFNLFYYLFSPFLWETTQNDPEGLTCR